MADRNFWLAMFAVIGMGHQFARTGALNVLLRNHRRVRHDAYDLLKRFVLVFCSDLFGHRIGQQLTMRPLKANMERAKLPCRIAVKEELRSRNYLHYAAAD